MAEKKKISSSYEIENYDEVFKKVCKRLNPKSILEIGILEGYSLNSFIRHTKSETKITAIDLFEDYPFKNSNYKNIKKMFSGFNNVNIERGNFFEYYKNSKKFDLIHIDISNDGSIYEFAVNEYLPLANKALVLEGGSVERDNVGWMKNYNKPKIHKFLDSLSEQYCYEVIDNFPSLTIFYRDPRDKIFFK